MKVPFWLIINKSGSIRTTKNRTGLKWNEVARKVDVELPDKLFQRPTLSATIIIDEAVAPECDIKADTVNNIEELLQREGYDVKLSISTPDNMPRCECGHTENDHYSTPQLSNCSRCKCQRFVIKEVN